MKPDELLFELHAPDGNTWSLYIDGRTEGLHDGTVVKNHALPHVQRLVAVQPVSSACWPEALKSIPDEASRIAA